MNQDPVIVKLLTQSKPIQYLFMALSCILVIWTVKKMLPKLGNDDDLRDLKLPKTK